MLRTRDIKEIPRDKPEKRQKELKLYWLGQAGFLLDFPGSRIVIDAYLSNSLNKKYHNTRFEHERMIPPPIPPGSLVGVDWVMSTHGHTDHMDPETLPALFDSNPRARYIVPRSQLDLALERGGPKERTIGIEVDESVALSDQLEVIAFPAAHEEEELDKQGCHRFLGFFFVGQGISILHSGDTVPFPGLTERLRHWRPQLALFPVNGRDEYRRVNGVPGNMTLEEASRYLSDELVGNVIGHHYGMFDFNTLDLTEGYRFLSSISGPLQARLMLAQLNKEYVCSDSVGG